MESNKSSQKQVCIDDYPELKEKLSNLELFEEKIRASLDFMREALSQDKEPQFREFWGVRRLLLPFFKEDLNPVMRSNLWQELVEISDEARRLKSILDEQAEFAIEQIDLAITAIEKDMENYEEKIQSTPVFPFETCEELQAKAEEYRTTQQELSYLNVVASKVGQLRREILKTNMRLREKNRFFKRMSKIGDLVFPKRKELIAKVSTSFMQDVDGFVEKYFSKDDSSVPFYILLDQIKVMQQMAKELTLNTQSFLHARECLSQCWDKVKKQEKEKKKEKGLSKEELFKNREKMVQKIEALEQKVEGLSPDQVEKEWQVVSQEMRATVLSKDDVKELRPRLNALKPFTEKKRSKEIQDKIAPRPRVKKEKLSFEMLLNKKDELSMEELQKEYDQAKRKIEKFEASEVEKDLLLKELDPIKMRLLEKAEEKILSSDQSADEKLKIVLQETGHERKKIKEAIDSHRKKLAGSGFDFDMALKYQEMLDLEKNRLEEIDEKIASLTEQLKTL